MALCVAKIDLVNEEAHREWSTPAEVVILISDMDMFDIHLNAVEERGKEGEADRRIKLRLGLLVFLGINLCLLSSCPFLRSCLSHFFFLFLMFSLFLLLALGIFGSDSSMHFSDVGEFILAVVGGINIPSEVLWRSSDKSMSSLGIRECFKIKACLNHLLAPRRYLLRSRTSEMS